MRNNRDGMEQPAEATAGVWPPPPETPHPLAAHDAQLTALIRASPPKRPLSRLLLVRELHRAMGLDLRQSLAVVNDYCDRRGILPQKTSPRQWPRGLLSFIPFGLSVVSLVHMFLFRHQLAAVHQRAARRALLLANVHFTVMIMCLMLLTLPFVVGMAYGIDRQRRREIEEAKRKVGAGAQE